MFDLNNEFKWFCLVTSAGLKQGDLDIERERAFIRQHKHKNRLEIAASSLTQSNKSRFPNSQNFSIFSNFMSGRSSSSIDLHHRLYKNSNGASTWMHSTTLYIQNRHEFRSSQQSSNISTGCVYNLRGA